MKEREKVIFHEFYGPFRNEVLVLLEDHGRTFRLTFDEGPEFKYEDLMKDNVTAFKFVAGVIVEIRVSVLFGRKLQFQGTQVPNVAALRDGLASKLPPPMCTSIGCAETIECPDSTKPIMICDDGPARCCAAEPES